MNILFISPNSPHDSVGGVERYITNLIQYCKNHAASTIFLILSTPGENRIVKDDNITIYYDHNLFISEHSDNLQKEISLKSRAFSVGVQDIIKKHDIHIICAENFHRGTPAAFSILLNMAAGSFNVPLVLRLHSFAKTDLETELINQLMWEKISCISKSVAGDCFHKGTDIHHLSTDYLGVDLNEFNTTSPADFDLKEELELAPETKIVLSAARIILGTQNIIREKGLINLIEAFSKISPRYTDLRLLIAVGKAPISLQNEFDQAYNMLLGYIKLHNIEKTTIVRTFKLEEMPSVYKGSDLFILPSENETFGQVFIESMACGLPVIGTKVGGIPEIISDSYNGYLVSSNDPSILAQKITKLINDDNLRHQFIEAGKKTVEENFTSEKQFANFFKMLENTASNSAH